MQNSRKAVKLHYYVNSKAKNKRNWFLGLHQGPVNFLTQQLSNSGA